MKMFTSADLRIEIFFPSDLAYSSPPPLSCPNLLSNYAVKATALTILYTQLTNLNESACTSPLQYVAKLTWYKNTLFVEFSIA